MTIVGRKCKGLLVAVAIVTGLMIAGGVTAQAQAAPQDQPDASGKDIYRGKPLTKSDIRNDTAPTTKLAKTFEAECPSNVTCVVVPAAYQNNNPADPVDYGNYDTANRPHDGMKINSVVIHDTEGSLESVLEAFQNPQFYVSTQYVIDSDGTIYQMVRNKDVAWHAGNWWVNMHSIGIEHVGHLANGHTEYTPEMYRASAKLVKWLAAKYDIPLDRQHIMGHDNVPATSTGRIPTMHTDPGPFWNWQKYMALLGAPVLPNAAPGSDFVTVAPVWPLNKQQVIGCSPSGACVPGQGGMFVSNFVYLHTAPNHTAPMITDPVLGQGSTQIENTAAKAYHGQQFAVAARKPDSNKGMWYQVWYDGQLAWFYSPWKAPTAFPTKGKYVTPKAGLTSIPVYGRPLPEQSEYPADFVPPVGSVPYPNPLAYTIPAGQKYTVVSGPVQNQHFFAWTFDSSLPYDHTVFKGNTEYVWIQYNGRMAFVKKTDVDLVK